MRLLAVGDPGLPAASCTKLRYVLGLLIQQSTLAIWEKWGAAGF